MHRLFNHEKHYLTFNNYLTDRFGQKVFRVSLDAQMTCPNRDGTKSTLGCLFCSAKRSGDLVIDPHQSLTWQYHKNLEMIHQKWPQGLIISYLQAGTNTYNSIDNLRAIYQEIINLDPKIIVLSVATRPDCLNQEIVDLLVEINQKVEVWVELGFQTVHQTTADLINRCYDNHVFEDALNLLSVANLKVVVHIINGLPNETKEMMVDTVKYLNQFNLFGIKIHMLHLMTNTPLATLYQQKPFKILSLDEFVDITVTQLRYLKETVVIHRLTGDAPRQSLICPTWTLKKFVVLNEIDKYMRLKGIYQGDLC